MTWFLPKRTSMITNANEYWSTEASAKTVLLFELQW
jgi:hypothetical protein